MFGRMTASVVFLIFIMTVATGATAATCTPIIAAKVTSAACQVGSDLGERDQNDDTAARVNADLLFGFSNWSFVLRDETFSGRNETLQVRSQLGGGYLLTPLAAFDQYMLVFGARSGNPDTYVGYLLNQVRGSYRSPFENDIGKTIPLDHISLYARASGTPPAPVPLPATGILLLVALGGLGLKRRRCAA